MFSGTSKLSVCFFTFLSLPHSARFIAQFSSCFYYLVSLPSSFKVSISAAFSSKCNNSIFGVKNVFRRRSHWHEAQFSPNFLLIVLQQLAANSETLFSQQISSTKLTIIWFNVFDACLNQKYHIMLNWWIEFRLYYKIKFKQVETVLASIFPSLYLSLVMLLSRLTQPLFLNFWLCATISKTMLMTGFEPPSSDVMDHSAKLVRCQTLANISFIKRLKDWLEFMTIKYQPSLKAINQLCFRNSQITSKQLYILSQL